LVGVASADCWTGIAWLTTGREGRLPAQAVSAITARTAVKMKALRLVVHRFHCAMSGSSF
jgi:hypothetical protein